ncbi:MAG: type II secretion system F family protein [Candidatus Omnitrophica bacterium]|nr:type II secretion system F family protein [Candidatus Omnitrophota bacterium]
MAVYKYRAKKGPGEIIEDIIEAVSEKEAVDKIIQTGYVPVRVEKKAAEHTSKQPVLSRKLSGRVRSVEITVFSRQLASLLKSGVPILNSISTIAEQSENPYLKSILYHSHKALKEGVAFSSALRQYPKVFSPLYIAMVRAGEDSSALPEALIRIAGYRTKQDDMMSRFRMALAYPMLMGLVGAGTIIFMLTFVMPRLMRIFVTMEQALPLPTRILISTSQFLRHNWFWIIAGIFIVIYLIRRQASTKIGRQAFSLLKLRLPMFGKFIVKAELARFNRTLELLIKNGVPILKAIEIAIPVLQNEILRQKLQQSCQDLKQGGSFGNSLKGSGLFPLFMSNLVMVGEESGKLDEALGEIATAYEHDTDTAIRTISTLMEPLMILIMGLIIGFMVIAMLLPVFEINVMAK